ncbi:MAG: hypothetical protein IKF96_05865, partial [Eggerthellaceae bacterium]|nr:hypothetical protein [Eggerthellaceae bacterium]
MEDNKRKLYDALSQDYDLGSFEQFSNDIADETKRRKLYDATSEEYDYGDFDTFSSQLGFGKSAEQPSVAETSSEPEDMSMDLNFNDEPDTRPLKESRRDMIARQQEAMRKEEEEAASKVSEAKRDMTPAQRTSAFNEEARKRDEKYRSALTEQQMAAADAQEKEIENQRRSELAAQKQTAEDVQRFGTGNENYSFEEGVAAGRAFAEIAPEIETFDTDLAAFNDKYRDLEDQIAQINAGKLKLSPEEYKQMQARYSEYEKESKALANVAKRYDEVLNTAPGKEYKAISERMDAISKAPKSAESALEYAQEYAKLQKNPLYRASLGADAPSDDEINAGLLQGQIAYLDEKMKTAKGDEKKQLKKAFSDAKESLYANPWYKQHLASKIEENKLENEQIGVQRAAHVQQLRAGYAEQGIDPNYYWQMEKGDKELQLLDAAAHMHDDAIREYEKPTKYDESKGRKNVAKGVGDWASDTDTWSFGIESFTENLAIVRPVLEKVDKIVGNVNEDDIITNGAIDELEKQLTPGELAVLDAYFEKVGALAAKGADTSIGYQIGQGIGDMFTLGLEMIATGGAGGAVRAGTERATKKALLKILGKRAYRKAATSGAGKVALWAATKIPADMVETAVRLPFMPSTFKAIGEGAVELDEGYHPRALSDSAPEKLWGQYVEQLTEVSNGFAFPLIGKIVKTPGMQKFFTEMVGENGARALREFVKRGDIKLLDDAMIGSFGGEWEEELLGAVIHSITDDRNALRDFFSAEQQLVLLGTLAPIPLTRGAVGGVQLAVPAASAAYRWNRAEAELKRLGFDEGRIARLKDVIDNASVTEGAREIMNAYQDAYEGMWEAEDAAENDILRGTLRAVGANPSSRSEGYNPKLYGDLARYFWAAQQKRAVGLMQEVQRDQKVEDKRAELEQTYGGQFYHPYTRANGETIDIVETATMLGPDGSLKDILITSETPNASGEMSYVSADGSKGFVRQDEIGSLQPDGTFMQTGETTVTPINQYLAGLVMQDEQTQELQGVANDVTAANQTLRQQVENLPEIKFNGKTGTLVRPTDEGAVFVPDDSSEENTPVTWSDLASQNGIQEPDIMTGQEKSELGAEAVVQRMAEQQQIAD